MRDVFKFIVWWWKTLAEVNKAFIGAATFVVVFFIAAVIFGPAKTLLTFFAGGILFLLYKGIRILVSSTRARWIQFQMFQEREREGIVSRLKGQR